MIKKFILAGLLVLVPIGVTVWVLHFLITTLDQSILLLPELWRPTWHGSKIPGLGVVFAFLLVVITGAIASTVGKNVIGKQILNWWSETLQRIPVVGAIYKSVKQISDPVLSDSGQAFRKAVLIEFPRAGLKTIAFVTTTTLHGEMAKRLPGDYLTLYVPTVPVPTSGYMLLVHRSQVEELDMTVEQALKYVISLGVAPPPVLTTGELARWANGPKPPDFPNTNP